uniref:Serum response factor-binding protein 1 n=1 Tax=Steinernema glaseri TaxID=37863 RepID=A0A1I8A212_9BILA
MTEGGELTAKVLNNEIVKFRHVVDRCAKRKIRELLRRGKQWSEHTNPQKQRRAKGLIEMALQLKHVNRDEVTKFALQNTKTSEELFNLKTATVEHRALFHLMSDKPFVAAVDSFRERYPKWFVEVPFILQRLGLKYAKNKAEKKGASLKGLYLPPKKDDGDESEEDDINDLGGVIEDDSKSEDEEQKTDEEELKVKEEDMETDDEEMETEEKEIKSEPKEEKPVPKARKPVQKEHKPKRKEQKPIKKEQKPIRKEKKPVRKEQKPVQRVQKKQQPELKGAKPERKAPKAEEKESLHPSWEAKRKLKEQMACGPSGKKITFDEEE